MATQDGREGLRGVRREPQKAAGNSTVPIVRFQYIPSAQIVSRWPFLEVLLFTHTHTHTLKQHSNTNVTRDEEIKNRIYRKQRAETSLSVRGRHEWAGALIIDRMIKADEEGVSPSEGS